MSDEQQKKPGWFQRWLGSDDPMDEPITADDAQQPNGGDDRG